MSDHSMPSIVDLASLLKLRRSNQQRTVLLLGSRAGGLFRSETFYESLSRFSTRSFMAMSQLEQFSYCYELLSGNRFSELDRFSILSSALRNISLTTTDERFAQLIKDGYFDVVISTNVDDVVEQALFEVGMKEGRDFYVLIPQRGEDLDVIHVQRNVPCWVIKVFGDLNSRSYTLSTYENRYWKNEVFQQTKQFLQKNLVGDILVVGLDPIWDADILSSFPDSGGQYWFVNEENFERYSTIGSTWRGRQVRHITGKMGSYDNFIREIYDLLNKSMKVEQPSSENSQRVHSSSRTTDTLKPSSPSESQSTDVLLVIVTDVEGKAVLDLFPQSKLLHIGDHSYHDLGVISGARTLMVQSLMGSGGAGGSLFTVSDSIRAVSPAAIIMLGIAFGVDPKKQKIGDILVSQKIMEYDPRRIGTDKNGQMLIYPRGDRVSASVRLLDRFRASTLRNDFKDWTQPPRVNFGLILSGSNLIDNEEFRDQLLALEPEAIGGEMEGAGLYDAAQRGKVDWILVKAICDWADGKKRFKKSERQKLAAESAARFVIAVLQQGGFATPNPS